MKAIVRALLSASLCVPVVAQEQATPTAPRVPYWSVWADRQGGTHVTRCEIANLALKTFAPPAAPEWVLKLPDAVDNVTFAVQPVGWLGEWHKNPQPQWVIPLSGWWFVETTDGSRVEMGPGEASFGGDQGARPVDGKLGHVSGTIGNEPAVLMVVQLKATGALRIGEACPFR
jgi:hypothetical protein